MSYASGTAVEVAKTQAEIQAVLVRFGADGFMSGQQRRPDGTEAAMVAFQFKGKMIRFVIALPASDDPKFKRTPGRQLIRTPAQAKEAWQQFCRERWRALLLAIKAKLVAIEEGISTLEQEFMAWIVLPNGMTAGDHLLPQIERASTTGQMPLLPWEATA